MNNFKCILIFLFVLLGGCSRWENDIAFSNHSEIDIKNVVFHFHDSEFDFGYIDKSLQKSYGGNSNDLSKGFEITWANTDDVGYKVSVNRRFFNLKKGGYLFTLMGDGSKIEVSKYKGKEEVDSIVLDAVKI